MLYIYPGGILAAIVQGEPVLSFLMAGPQLYTSLASWYLIFYCPLDMAFTLFKTLRLQYIFLILQDWQRLGKKTFIFCLIKVPLFVLNKPLH